MSDDIKLDLMADGKPVRKIREFNPATEPVLALYELPIASVMPATKNVEAIHSISEVVMDDQTSDSVQALAKSLGYEGELTIGGVENNIRFYQRRTAEACVELGKCMLLLKEMTLHGEFTKRVELLGFDKRLTQRFMNAAKRFSKSGTKTLLNKVGSQTKFLELLVLDDDELETLEAGGEVRGIELDDIDCMSASELRTALRAEQDNHQKQTNQLNTKLNTALNHLSAYEKKLPEPLLTRMVDAQIQECLNAEAMAAAGCDLLGLQIKEILKGGDYIEERFMTLHSCVLAIQSRDVILLQALIDAAEQFNINLPDRPKMALNESMARDYLAAHTGYIQTAIELAKQVIQGRTDVLGRGRGRPIKTK